jgi:TatD DNase family protein
VPKRGRRNEPAFLPHVAARLAEVRGESLDHIAETTYQNACRFYGLPY